MGGSLAVKFCQSCHADFLHLLRHLTDEEEYFDYCGECHSFSLHCYRLAVMLSKFSSQYTGCLVTVETRFPKDVVAAENIN